VVANDIEYRATEAAIRRFEEALAHIGDRASARHPLIQQAMQEQIEGELETLRAQLAEYEAGQRLPVWVGYPAAVAADTRLVGTPAAGTAELRQLLYELVVQPRVVPAMSSEPSARPVVAMRAITIPG
jgi:hypothetical protein